MSRLNTQLIVVLLPTKGPVHENPSVQPAPSPIWDIPLTIQDCWLPTARLPAFLIAPNCFFLPALSPPYLSPASLIDA